MTVIFIKLLLILEVSSLFRTSSSLYMISYKGNKLKNSIKPSRLVMVYEVQKDIRVLIKRSDVILYIPTNDIPMKNIEVLRKLIPSTIETAVVGSSKLIEAIDSTPFCTMVSYVRGSSNLIVFLKESDETVYENFLKWVRQVSSTSLDLNTSVTTVPIVIAKKDHIICLQVNMM